MLKKTRCRAHDARPPSTHSHGERDAMIRTIGIIQGHYECRSHRLFDLRFIEKVDRSGFIDQLYR